jgi:hypothetical protein
MTDNERPDATAPIPEQIPDQAPEQAEADDRRTLNRRAFIAAGGAAAAGIGVAGFAVGRHTDLFESSEADSAPDIRTSSMQYDDVPETPHEPPDSSVLRFFTVHEAATVDALTSRILPGTPDDPGAHEAGVVIYIDNLLAVRDGLQEPVYRAGPFAVTSGETDLPATPQASPIATQVVLVASDQIERYGYQSLLTPADVYRIGIAALDRYTNTALGSDFVDLTPDQQDQVVGDLAKDKISPFDPNLTAVSFFKNLRNHTAEGMFSDPVYGGNRNLAGWKLVGFPGAQRAYSPDEIRNPAFSRPPQSIVDLMAQMPGMATNDNAILPINGSDEHEEH